MQLNEITLKARTLAALAGMGAAPFDAVATALGECPRRVRFSLYKLHRQGMVTVSGHTPLLGPGRPRALFTPRATFALQAHW
jgi:hypothetical protein